MQNKTEQQYSIKYEKTITHLDSFKILGERFRPKDQ